MRAKNCTDRAARNNRPGKKVQWYAIARPRPICVGWQNWQPSELATYFGQVDWRIRAHCENRPLLQAPNRREVLEQLLDQRDPLYREIADLVLESDGHNARWLVKEIVRYLDEPVGAS